ncbi:hypothetical protein LWC35_05945 [Pseudonocardia kujensis]|nr:hypothetical protein [Pseudonocardia kujensis]
MHAIRNASTPADLCRITAALDAAGVDAIEVAHGDGLAGASLTFGPGSNTDDVVQNAVFTTLLLPGIGTLYELQKAYDLGVRSVRVAMHSTEADIAVQHIGKARELGMDVSGSLMVSH